MTAVLNVKPLTTVVRRGRDASDALTVAILNAASRGQRPHCSDAGTGGMWLSEEPADRHEATTLCRGCVVLTECGQAADANNETFGVWGGRDFTRRPGKKKAA